MRERERLGGLNKIAAILTVVAVTGLIAVAASWSGRADNGADNRRDDAPGLFTSASAPGLQHANPAALRHRPVTVDAEVLDEKWVLFNLFDDTEVVAERTHIKHGPWGDTTWSGELVDFMYGSVTFTVMGDAVSGQISWPGHLFEVITTPAGDIVIQEIDLPALPPHTDPFAPEELGFADLAGEDSTASTTTTSGVTASADTGDIVDVMMIYTAASRALYGLAGIEARIINTINAANGAYANSGVTHRLRLVHMAEVDYTETGDMTDALYDVTDGLIPGVDALRDTYGADIVSMIDEDTNYCGIAWVMSTVANWMEAYGFNVTKSSCMTSHTVTHEIGHNQGNLHDRANSGSGGAYPYSYGYRNTTAGFRTIMAYSCRGGGCPRVDHMSNPNVLYNGWPTGIDDDIDPANSADNARSMNNTDSTVANWRLAVDPTVPAAPSNLSVAAPSDTAIDLTWSDNSANEDGYLVERSPDGVNNWAQIANLAANTTAFTDNGLTADTAYYYRIRAFNGVGNSDYSNTATATTSGANTAPTAGDDAAATSEDVAVVIFVIANDSDAEDGQPGVQSAGNGANGTTVVNADGTITYTPNADFNGADSFTYTAVDSGGMTDTALVTVTVSAVNDAPVAGDDAAETEQGVAVVIDLLANDGDAEDGTPTVQSVGAATNGAVAVDGNGMATYTPNAGYNGPDIFTYTVVDSDGLTDTATVAVTVNPAPEPIHVGDLDVTVSGKKRWTGVVGLTVHDSGDAPVAGATVSGKWSNGGSASCVTDGSGRCDVSKTTKDATMTFSVIDLTGSAMTYAAAANHDPDGDSDGTSIVLGDQGAGNGAPSFDTDPIAGAGAVSGQAYAGGLAGEASDPDGDALSFAKLSGPSWLSVASDGALSGTPGDGHIGLNEFTVEVADPSGLTDTASLQINVTAPGAVIDVHVGDLDGAASGGGNWKATVTISVHDAADNPVSGVTVAGSWSLGANGNASCVTGAAGQCALSKRTRNTSVTFTVSGLSGTGFLHAAGSDHDVDGGTDGKTITIAKP